MKCNYCTSKGVDDDFISLSSVSFSFISAAGFTFDFVSDGIGNNIQDSR
jgi:hypothetical protein